MNRLEINNGNKITLYGSNAVIQSEKSIIESLNLTGNEPTDRLIIQKCIDDNNLKSKILYDGNTVYSLKKIVKLYRRLQKTGTLEKMNNEMYHFFTNACGDIAHYDIDGFRVYYNNSLQNLENSLLKSPFYYTTRFSDFDEICKKLKIGKYFSERDNIDIDVVSTKKIKEFINECGFDVKVTENLWELSTTKKDYNVDSITNGTTITFKPSEKRRLDFSFKISVADAKPSKVISEINNYYKNFNKDNYVIQTYEANKEQSDPPTISEIVYNTDYFVSKLSKLAENILYKCKNEAEILMDSVRDQNTALNFDLELEFER